MQSKAGGVVVGVQLNLTKSEAIQLISYMSKTFFEPNEEEHALANAVIRHLQRALNGETT